MDGIHVDDVDVDVDAVERMASDILSLVRDFVEALRTEFRPRKQLPQSLKDIPLFSRMKVRGLPEKLRCIQNQDKKHTMEEFDKGKDDYSPTSLSFEGQRRSVLSEVALPIAQLLATSYRILDNLPESKPPAKVEPLKDLSSRSPRCRRSKHRPAPPRGMLSIQDYTDIACLLEFIVCTGILPSHKDETTPSGNSNSTTGINALVEDRLRTKLPKSLAGRIPKDALRWGTSSASSSDGNRDKPHESQYLLVRTTETIASVVVLDRFRPMLLPRHIVDIYGAIFKIEFCAAERGVAGDTKFVDPKLYRILGLSLASSKETSISITVDPALRAMAYQTLLSSSSQPNGSTKGNESQLQRQQYQPWLQKRVSELLTDLATKDLRGLSAVLTVFVPVLSSSTNQAALMAGASQRLGRTLAAMTATRSNTNQNGQNLQGRLCQQLLQLLSLAVPMKSVTEANGIPPRSLAMIQTAWAFFEHLSPTIIERFVHRKWANSMVSKVPSTEIHESIRQIGTLCAFVPPHSTSASKFLQKAALSENESFGDSTLLGQILRVAVIRNSEGNSIRTFTAREDAHQTLLSLTQAIYVGISGTASSSSSKSEEESVRDHIVAAWIAALGPTTWDLEGHSYASKKLPENNETPMEMITVQTQTPLLTPTSMEKFVASIELTTKLAEFFVEKILLVLAPPPTQGSSNEEEEAQEILQELPSRTFRYLLRQYLSGEKDGRDQGNSKLVSTVLLPMLCEKCSQEQLLFGSHRDGASGLLLLIRQVLSEMVEARNFANVGHSDDGYGHEVLKSIAGILTSLLIALMEVGSKSRTGEEEEILKSFFPILQSLSVSTTENSHSDSQDDRKDDAAMADMAAYAMALIASRSSVATDENEQTQSKALLSAEERLQVILEEAEKDLGSTQPPIRAKGMVSLGRLARGFTGALTQEQKAPSLIQELDESGQEIVGVDETMDRWIEKVLELSMMALSDKESYVFLAAIQTIVAVGDLHPQKVLPRIVSTIVQGQLTVEQDTIIPLSQEQVIKLADALIFIIRRRAVTDEYVPILINRMVRGEAPTTTAANGNFSPKDRRRVQEETANYFATGSRTSGKKCPEDDEDSIERTQKEQWEERDTRLKTGGPVFDFEEPDVVRALRITIVSELVASASPFALAPYIQMLTNLAKEALYLEEDSRMVQRSAALLARELYARVRKEALDLTDALGRMENTCSDPAVIPISTALVESDEEALRASLERGSVSGFGQSEIVVPDSTVVARCNEALDLRQQAQDAGVLVAAKLVLEERKQLEAMPTLFRTIASPQPTNGGEEQEQSKLPAGCILNPVETLR